MEFVIAGRRVVGYSVLDAAGRLADLVSEGERVVDVDDDPWAEEDAYWAELEGDGEA